MTAASTTSTHSPTSAHSSLPPIALHHILLKSSLLADEVMNELTLGADFSEMAAEYSTCPSAQQQGFAGYHNPDQLPASLIKALSDYQGDSPWCGPVKSKYGFHILKPVGVMARPLLVDDADDELVDVNINNSSDEPLTEPLNQR